MVDIDFDEIDRAVAGATGVKAASSAVASDAASDDQSGTTAVKVTTRSAPPASSPASRRSSGRFMDVVHPSSDMRSSSAVPPRPSATEASERQPDEAPAAPVSDMPDPLDFHGFNMEESPAPSTPASDDESQPLDSPFLPDAKVEKRPLGAFSSAESSTQESDTSVESAESAETPSADQSTELNAPLPSELQSDVLQLEADAPVEPTEAQTTDTTMTQPTAAVQDAPVIPSITQQYKETPPSQDQPSGAIFDTESYHQALKHPAKKKSGALIVVWILALILVGAGSGAAIYFFVLPLL